MRRNGCLYGCLKATSLREEQVRQEEEREEEQIWKTLYSGQHNCTMDRAQCTSYTGSHSTITLLHDVEGLFF